MTSDAKRNGVCTMLSLTAARSRGFTVIELAFTLAIVSILLPATLPGLRTAVLGSDLTAQTSELLTAIHLARNEAVKRNVAVKVCPSVNAQSCLVGATVADWRRGWVVRTQAEVIRANARIETNVVITGTVTAIDFAATGTSNLTDAGSLILCSGELTPGKRIRITATGRAYVATANCSSQGLTSEHTSPRSTVSSRASI